MSVRPDAALLDQRLEQLLEADLAERERLLSEIDEPSASLLRRMLAVASDTQTTTLSGMQAPWLQNIGEIAPPPIPGLRFIAEIGRGGMAVVYAAERDVHGVAEPVAVKLLAGAVQNELEEHRFLNEQRILAELKHPNIATLLDVGICDGRAYMVMERIDGVPIDQARSISQVGIESLLDAVLQVADALQAAHARLVIHRDIKPGNVLVDAHGQVKLIDFGIAKRLVDQPFVTKDTLTGTMPLTLRYASPEQLMGKAVGVGSDIYQLGLLCYVLLTGLWPYPDEGEGSFPSQRLQSQGGPELASRRVREPRLRRLLEGDLDSILLKCLSFAPADRYRSMDEFSEDIRRYRERQPVRARRQTRWYLAQRFLARHRLVASVALAAVILMAVGTLAAVHDAERQRDYARRSEALLNTLTQVLSAGDPFSDDAGQTPISEVLDRAEQQYLRQTDADPEFQVRVLMQLATIRISLREYEQAATLLHRAQELARAHPLNFAQQAELTLTHARALAELGQLTEADRLLIDSGLLVPVSQAGPAQLAGLLLQMQIRQEQGAHDVHAEMLPQLAARVSELPESPPTLRHDIASEYARALVDQGKPDEAQQQLDQAQRALDELDRPYERQVRLHFARALAHALSHRLDEAEHEYQKALALADARVGPNHPVRLVLLTNYGSLLLRQRLYEQSYQLLAPLEGQAARLENPRQRASLYDGIAVSALQTGRSEAAVAATLQRLRTLAEIEPRQRADIRPDYAAQTAWLLFEVGDNELAKAYSEHAAPGATPGNGARLVSLITSELLGQSSPFTIADLDRPCTQAQYRTFRAALVSGQLNLEGVIPADCNPQTTARLQAMGMKPGPAVDTRLIDRVSFDSPLLQRILKNAPVVPLDPDTRRDFLDLLKRFEADQEKASSIKLPPTPSAVP